MLQDGSAHNYKINDYLPETVNQNYYRDKHFTKNNNLLALSDTNPGNPQ